MGDFDRIRWRCRRGLLELDLVLEAFLARGYGRLDDSGRILFDELLERPDNELLDLALGRSEPGARYRAVVELLRADSGPAPAEGVGSARPLTPSPSPEWRGQTDGGKCADGHLHEER